MTAGGGHRGKSEGSLAALAAGRAAGIAKRRAVQEAGMTAARAWRSEHHAVPAVEHMPFEGHRTQREVREHIEALDQSAERMASLFAGKPAE